MSVLPIDIVFTIVKFFFSLVVFLGQGSEFMAELWLGYSSSKLETIGNGLFYLYFSVLYCLLVLNVCVRIFIYCFFNDREEMIKEKGCPYS